MRRVSATFLCDVDARAKLALATATAAATALPLQPLAVVALGFAALLVAGGLFAHALAALRRIALLLVLLFALDWLIVDLPYAALITLRVALLNSAFVLVVATTEPEELCRAFERLGLPRRAAFTLAIAFRSTALLADEWRAIVEAQRARGLTPPALTWRRWRPTLAYAVALVVPAIVLATQRAWSLSEAAVVRGLESPRPRALPSRNLALGDHLLLAAAAGLLVGLFACR